jgi:hypothetical protein
MKKAKTGWIGMWRNKTYICAKRKQRDSHTQTSRCIHTLFRFRRLLYYQSLEATTAYAGELSTPDAHLDGFKIGIKRSQRGIEVPFAKVDESSCPTQEKILPC